MALNYGISILVFFVIFVEIFGTRELIVCSIPDDFTVQISNNRNVEIYGNELTIKYQDLGVYAYPGTNTVNIVLTNTSINFRAYMIVESFNTSEPLAERINWSNNGLIIGLGELEKTNSDEYEARQYHFFLPSNITVSSNLYSMVENEIRQYIHSCLQKKISTEKVTAEQLKRLKQMGDLGIALVLPNPDCSNETLPSCKPLPKANRFKINRIVDSILNETMDMLKRTNSEIIILPNVNKKFSTNTGLFTIHGRIETFGGTFEGFTTLKRATNAVLSQQGDKYTISCGLGISIARLNFKYYKLTYGPLEVCGKMSVNVTNVAVEAKISADYDIVPCLVKLEYVKIIELGKLQINLTGLGPLTKYGSKLINWIVKHWHKFIETEIQTRLTVMINNQLSRFSCEKYRINQILL